MSEDTVAGRGERSAGVIDEYYGAGRSSTVLYDVLEGIFRPVGPEVAFYLELAGGIGTPILDLGCGTGRIAWALAEAGRRVVGVDCAAAMLDLARRKAGNYDEAVRERVSFLAGNGCSLQLGRTFDLVLSPHRVFNELLTLADQRAFLASIRRHLAPGGRAVLDTSRVPYEHIFNRSELLSRPPMVVNFPHLGLHLERRPVDIRTDLLDQTVEVHIRFTMKTAAGAIHSDHVDRTMQRWAAPAEMRLLFELAGFCILGEYQGYDRSPLQGQGDCVWVLEAVS